MNPSTVPSDPDGRRRNRIELAPEDKRSVLARAWILLANHLASKQDVDRDSLLTAICLHILDQGAIEFEELKAIVEDKQTLQDALAKHNVPVLQEETRRDLANWLTGKVHRPHFFKNCLRKDLDRIVVAASHDAWQGSMFEAQVSSRRQDAEARLVYRPRGKVLIRSDFVNELAASEEIVLLGITHQNLSKYLENAWERRRASGNGSFWQRVEIVFLDDSMLERVHDENTEENLDDLAQAARLRRQMAATARDNIRQVLPDKWCGHRWKLRKYRFMLPFIGAMFESPRRRSVQVAFFNPGMATSTRLFVEYSAHSRNRRDRELFLYCERIFNTILQYSEPERILRPE